MLLTKTKQLIMNKRQQQSSSSHLHEIQQPQISPPTQIGHKSLIHISHTNEYQFIPNQYRKQPLLNIEFHKQLEAQNLRLIEENMRLTKWSHLMLDKMREGVRKAISTIQEFRYLEGVNILYSLLAQVSDYQSSKLVTGASQMNYCVQSWPQGRYANPQSNGSLVLQFQQKLKICSELDFKIIPTKNVELNILEGQFPSFVRPKAQIVKQDEQTLWRMLLVQAETIDSMPGVR